MRRKIAGGFLLLLFIQYTAMLGAYNLHILLTNQKSFTLLPWTMGKAMSGDPAIGKLFFAFAGMLLLVILYLVTRNVYTDSSVEMVTVVPGIKIPAAYGQNQYGSARFLSKAEWEETFLKAKLNIRNDKLRYLMDVGRIDLEEGYDPEKDEPIHYEPLEAGGIVIGQPEDGKTLYLVDSDTHTYCIGATRSHKTRNIVIPSACATALAGESMIFCDPKGEISAYMSAFLRRLEYELIYIDFQNPERSSQYNFLQPIIDFVNAEDLARASSATWEIVEALVGESKGEPIWHNGECSIIACCIMAVVYDNRSRPEYQNLTNVYHFIGRMCAVQPDGKTYPIIEYLNGLDEEHPAKSLAGISQVSHIRTRSSFYTSAMATLRLFEGAYIANMTSKTTFDIYATGKRKRAIFIILPDEKSAYYPIASLFVYQHYQLMIGVAKEHGGRLPRRVECFLDEIGNFTYMPDFDKSLTVGAGRGVRYHLFLQDPAQLENKYNREIAKIVRSNCETWLYLQTNDTETLELLSKRLGNYTTRAPNVSATATTTGSSTSSGHSYMARPLLFDHEIGKIERPYQMVIVTKGPAILYSPDLSKTVFNDMLGLGDPQHNQEVIRKRTSKRPARIIKPPELWGVWGIYEQHFVDDAPPPPDEAPPFRGMFKPTKKGDLL